MEKKEIFSMIVSAIFEESSSKIAKIENITPDKKIEDLGIDSFDKTSIFFNIGISLKVDFTDEEKDKVVTVKDFFNLVIKKLEFKY